MSESAWQPALQIVPLSIVLAAGFASFFVFCVRQRSFRRRSRLNDYLRTVEADTILAGTPSDAADDELSKQDLQLVRLLLDRALQPIGDFEGFEWIDQFQTAAVRYQLNFMSYALSIAQAVHVPAFHGYFHTAQQNLAVKQQDPRIWRYWKLENMWGNLRMQADPIARDNIMFSGFVAAQIAYQQAATGKRPFDAPGSLTFAQESGERYVYSLPALIDVLSRGYRDSSFGLIACEPNWIYPMCNAISASAIRAYASANGTSHWDEIENAFRRCLEAEFITAGGRFIPFRSGYTGFAAPPIGGAVMQALPCLFLNAVLPDIAQRQWMILRRDLEGRDWKRALWPVDVGNYRFSRASSYAATAAAATEMGDTVVANRLLQYLDEECPLQVSGDVANRRNASLWAHAVELMARCGRAGTLRALASTPPRGPVSGPFIKSANYPDILVAKAVNADGALFAVVYPGGGPDIKTLTIGGLAPNQSYVAEAGETYRFTANPVGVARLNLRLRGRTELRLTRAV